MRNRSEVTQLIIARGVRAADKGKVNRKRIQSTMVTLIVSTNEAYLGWIMYLALQMQPSIHLPCHMSHRITSRGTRRAFPLPLNNRARKTNPAPSISPEAQLARTGTCGDTRRGHSHPQHGQELPKDQGLQQGCHSTCWRAATCPAARCHLLYSISSCSSPRGGCSVSRR